MKSRTNLITALIFVSVLALSITAAKKNVMHVIDQTLCNQCGDCVKACEQNAIKVIMVGDKKKHEIDPALCNQCGDCIDPCKEDAIMVISCKTDKKSPAKSK